MKPDEHLRAALRHAPDADLQAPLDLGAQIVAAAHRAAAEPAPHSVKHLPCRSWWAAWRNGPPLRLGASGALASVLLAGVIGLVWQAGPPGPARDPLGDESIPVAAAPEVATTAMPAAPPTRTTPTPDAIVPPARPVRPEASDAATRPVGQALRAAGRRLEAPAPVAAPPQPLPAAPPAPSVPPAAAPPAARSPALAEAAALPTPAAVAPGMATPAPPAEAATNTANTSTSHWRATPARAAAAAAPVPLRATALAAATVPAPWAALLADPAPSHWLVDGRDLPVDSDWLRKLFQHTRGRWAHAPAAAPQADDLQIDWLQGDGSAARLWLGRDQATWCSPAPTCQSAPLPQAAASVLKDTLKRKLPR